VESDPESANIAAFVSAWWLKYGNREVGTHDLRELAQDLDLGDGNERSQQVRLGKRLHRLRDWQLGGYRVVYTRDLKKAAQYKLELVGRDK